MTGAASAVDPFRFQELLVSGFNETGNTDTSVKTRVSRIINGGIRNGVILIAGASNMANVAPTSYTPTNSTKIDNFNLYDGAMYADLDPQLGCSGFQPPQSIYGLGNFSGRLGDLWINANTFDRVILMTIAQGGSKGADWASGGVCNQRYIAAIKRLNYNGIPLVGQILGMGENDFGSTSQASYTASQNSLFATSAAMGVTAPWFVNIESYNNGNTDSNITNAQIAVVNHAASPPIWQGPNLDTLGSSFRQSDNLHFNDSGMTQVASLMQTALHAYGAPF